MGMREETNISLPGTGDIDFEPIIEPWSRYRLSNGAILEVRLILLNVKPEAPNEFGERYSFQINGVARVVSPKKLLT